MHLEINLDIPKMGHNHKYKCDGFELSAAIDLLRKFPYQTTLPGMIK